MQPGPAMACQAEAGAGLLETVAAAMASPRAVLMIRARVKAGRRALGTCAPSGGEVAGVGMTCGDVAGDTACGGGSPGIWRARLQSWRHSAGSWPQLLTKAAVRSQVGNRRPLSAWESAAG